MCWKVLSILGFPEFQKLVATSSSASSKWDAPFPPFAWAGSATRVMVPAIWVHLARNPVLWMASPAPEWSLIWKFRASPPNYKVSAEAKNWRRCCSGTHPTTTPPPPPPVLGMSDLATENLDLTGFERAVGILWTSSGFPRHPLASKMWWWWTLMDSAGQLATVARTDLIKSDLHGSDQSTELVRSRHFDISVHRVQSRFILGLMTSRDGIFKVGAIWYQALTWIWGTNMEQVEYISIWLSCNGNAYKSYIEVPCAQCSLESGWVYLEFSLARACSVFWFPQSFNGNICMVLKDWI